MVIGKPFKTCVNFVRCGGTTSQGAYCAKCKTPRTQKRAPSSDARKAKERIYNSQQWQITRAQVLSEQPFCPARRPDGLTCNLPTTDVDHILSLENGGEPFERKNLRAWCHAHHAHRTARDDGSFGNSRATGRITIVCGPPGAGKTTYVRQHAQSGDLIIDLDAIGAAISGLEPWDTPLALKPFMWEARDAMLKKLQSSPTIRAWIIDCAGEAAKREELRLRFSAQVIVLIPDRALIHQRVAERAVQRDWRRLVDEWFYAYTPSKYDVCISG